MNAVRKCLQVSLVNFLRPYQNPTCEEIKTAAYDSHSVCYLNPPDEAPSICDIGFENWLQIVVTIHSALAELRVIGQSLVTAGSCFETYIDRSVNIIVSLTEKGFDKATELIEKLVIDIYNDAKKYLDDIFVQAFQRIDNQIPRLRRSESNATYTIVTLLVVPRNKYDLNYNGRSTKNTTELIASFLDLVDSKNITYTEIIGIELVEYMECSDTSCSSPLRTVKAPPPRQASTGTITKPGTAILTTVVLSVYISFALIFKD